MANTAHLYSKYGTHLYSRYGKYSKYGTHLYSKYGKYSKPDDEGANVYSRVRTVGR